MYNTNATSSYCKVAYVYFAEQGSSGTHIDSVLVAEYMFSAGANSDSTFVAECLGVATPQSSPSRSAPVLHSQMAAI